MMTQENSFPYIDEGQQYDSVDELVEDQKRRVAQFILAQAQEFIEKAQGIRLSERQLRELAVKLMPICQMQDQQLDAMRERFLVATGEMTLH